MTHNNYTLLLFLGIAFFSIVGYGQVGINTTTPSGVLDINTTTTGFVYPSVALTDVTVKTITNPNALVPTGIVAGTVVYNTNTNTPAIVKNSVYPGIYVWNGSKWVPQFSKKDVKFFEQNGDVRTGSNDATNGTLGDQTIPFDVATNYPVAPKYNGKYKIEIKVHYGGGALTVPTPINSGNNNRGYTNFSAEKGRFKFTFNGGTPYEFDTRSFSGYNNDRLFRGTAALVQTNTYTQYTYIIEETLLVGNTYTFNLVFNQENAPAFQGNGDISVSPAGDGRGYVVINDSTIKCAVEITYIGE